MSLVDYASSSGEEDNSEDDVAAEATTASVAAPTQRPQGAAPSPPTPPPPLPEDRAPQVATEALMPSNKATSSARPAIDLPDASLLFASSSSFPSRTIAGNDHASRVAAAMSANVPRKREANGKVAQLPQNKHPRGSFPPRYVPGRSSSLIPPQLLGRSNVATEDINKLFVNRRPPS